MNQLFLEALVYLGAALLVVPLAKRLGLGSVLGYLLAGAIIGPCGLDLVGASEDVMHFAEFGVVMMLFLVGLELEPATLWRLRGPILGLGGAQVAITAVVLATGAIAVGLPWQQAVGAGLILAMSSTAIGLQTLAEKGLLRSDAGQKSFSVLLFQDIAVIPMLAAFPLLATVPMDAHADDAAHANPSLIAGLPAWQQGAIVLGAILLVIVVGGYLVRPAMRVVAATGLREMFTAAALLLVVGVTVLMSMVGLSPALGAFLAGVMLANSEYRHELESDIEPFKGLLLGLFFIAVGASMDFGLLAGAPVRVLALLGGVMAVKIGVLIALARGARTDPSQTAVFAAALGQVGEFAFVLLAFARGNGVLPDDVASTLVAVTALSMAASPIAFTVVERVILPRLRPEAAAEREPDAIDEHAPVIIAGFGRFGQICGRFLRANGVGVTVLDSDIDQIEILRRFGTTVHYGDASRLDLLRAAGAATARLLIVAVDDHHKALDIVRQVQKHFPHLPVLARARGRTEAYDLVELGVDGVYRETFDTSIRVGVDALRRLGVHGHRAHRAARTFRHHDEETVRELAAVRKDTATLVRTARERISALNAVLQTDTRDAAEFRDHGWDTHAIRAGLGLVPEGDDDDELTSA